MTDNEILNSIYENAVDGMTLLIDTYADLIYKVVYEVLSDVGTQEDIEDCICDTFIAFFDNIDDVDSERGSIKGVLGIIARRRAINLRYTLNPDDESVFDEYTAEEMSEKLENEEVLKSEGISDIIIGKCLKEIAPELMEEAIEVSSEAEEIQYSAEDDEETEEDFAEDSEVEAEAFSETVNRKRKRVGRVRKTFVAIIAVMTVIVVAVVAYNKLSVPKYVPPTTQSTTQASSFNPLRDAISAGNQKLIEELITNSLLLSQDVLKFAVESADKISYDSIRRIAEEVKNKYGSTGLDPILEGAIFGDFQSVEEKLKNKDESEMTPAEKLALFFITTFEGYAGQ